MVAAAYVNTIATISNETYYTLLQQHTESIFSVITCANSLEVAHRKMTMNALPWNFM